MRITFGEFTLDARSFELVRAGTGVPLEPKVFDVLHYLVRQRGRVVSKREILAALWPDEHVIDAVVARCVYEARKALGQRDVHGGPLATVRGRGYSFVAEVTVDDDAGAVRAATPFVGRSAVMRRLSGMLAEARSGCGGIVLLAGEPGIGKTRVAEELALQARRLGAEVWTARCDGTQSAPSFWPFTEIVRRCLRALPKSRADAALGASRSYLDALLPEAEPKPPASAAISIEDARSSPEFLLFDAVARLLHAACAEVPVVVVLDDVQWADVPSLRLLGFLARDAGEHALLVVCTLRQSELDPTDPRKARLDQLSRLPRVERIALDPLQPSDVQAYVAELFGRELPDLSRTLYERSEGYPFFMVEALRPHGLDAAQALHAVTQPLTDASRTIVRERLQRLPEGCLRLLEVAAVAGRAFDPGLVALAAESGVELPAARVLELLGPALDCCVLRAARDAPGRLEFAHSFMREVVYADLAVARRVQLHFQVFSALERLSPAAYAELAFHLRSGLPLATPDALVRYAVLAGHAAAAQHAYEDALGHYRHALAALDLRPDANSTQARIEILLPLGHAQRKAGELSEALESFDLAATLAARSGLHALFAHAVLGLRDCQPLRASQATPVQALLLRALAQLPEREIVLRARVSSRLAFGGTPEQRRAMSACAAQLARAIDDPAALSDVLNARLAAAQDPAEIGEKLAIADELERLARRHAEPNWAWEARAAKYDAYLRLGDMTQAFAALDACAALARELKHAAMQREVERYRAQRALCEGRYTEADAGMKQVRALRSPLTADLAEVHFAVQRLWLMRDLGRLDALGDALEVFVTRHRWAEETARASIGRIYVEQGEAARARGCLEYYARTNFENVPYGKDYVATCAHLAALASGLRDRTASERVHAMLAPYAHHNVVDRMLLCFGSASHYLGLLACVLGDAAQACARFEHAIAANERTGMLPALVRSELAYAALLEGANIDVGRARALRAQALARAERLGMRGALVELGEPPGAIPE